MHKEVVNQQPAASCSSTSNARAISTQKHTQQTTTKKEQTSARVGDKEWRYLSRKTVKAVV
jgi:hypothetical protein